jgi:AraC-like DNA-binding protein
LSLPQLAFAIDTANVTLAILLGVSVLVVLRGRGNAQLVALLALAAVAYIVLGRDDYSYWIPEPFRISTGGWRPVFNLLRNSGPGLFMILAHRLFTDRRRVPAWLLALFALQLFLEEPAQAALPLEGRSAWLAFEVGPTLLQTLFAGLAIYWTVAYWRADLVEARRRSRAVVLLVVGMDVVASSLLLRVLIPQQSIANYLTHVGLSVASLAIAGFILVGLMAGEASAYLEGRPRRAGQAQRGTEDAAAVARLKGLMQDERLYREPGLTLKALADRAGVPEYRLRRLIHEALGFRNFNAFLHHYRIAEACEQLGDPNLRRTPVLTIALSVGYQSVNTFNRGFRDVMGMTPTDYRAGPAETASPKSE